MKIFNLNEGLSVAHDDLMTDCGSEDNVRYFCKDWTDEDYERFLSYHSRAELKNVIWIDFVPTR